MSTAPPPAPSRILLHPQQAEFLNCTEPFAAFVGGIGSGKTFVLCYDLLRRARAGRLYMVLAPSYPMLRDVTIRSFFDLARRLNVSTEYVRSEHRCVLKRTGAEVLFRSADNPEMLRGPNLSGVSIDEASLVGRDVYDVAIGRLRQGTSVGFLRAVFTPKGPTHWTYSTFKDAPDVALFKASTYDNPFLPAEFADTVARQYGDTSYARQELFGEFVSVESATFPAEWFAFPGFLVPEWPDGISHNVLYLDPSQGKDSRSGDAQAYVRAGFWPGPNRENWFFLECHATREPPPDMVARGVRLCKALRPDLWSFETNGTLGLLQAEINRQLREANAPIRTWPVVNTDPKRWRIRNALMPYLAQKRIRIVDTPGGRLLKAQLSDEPHSQWDDCSDAAAGAITELEKLVLSR